MYWRALGGILLLSGCRPQLAPEAPAVDPRTAAPSAAPSQGSFAHLYDDSGRPLAAEPSGEVLAPRAKARPAEMDEPAFAVGRRGRPHNIRLRDARLDNVITVLARLAGYGVIIDDGLSRPITVELDNVAPYEALRAVAAAHGLAIEPRGDVLIVQSKAAPDLDVGDP